MFVLPHPPSGIKMGLVNNTKENLSCTPVSSNGSLVHLFNKQNPSHIDTPSLHRLWRTLDFVFSAALCPKPFLCLLTTTKRGRQLHQQQLPGPKSESCTRSCTSFQMMSWNGVVARHKEQTKRVVKRPVIVPPEPPNRRQRLGRAWAQSTIPWSLMETLSLAWTREL